MKAALFWRIVLVSTIMALPACGESSGLSRGKAEKIIEEHVNKHPESFPNVEAHLGRVTVVMPEREFRYDSVCLGLFDRTVNPIDAFTYMYPKGNWLNWANAQEQGFLNTSATKYQYRYLGDPRLGLECQLQLTDKAKPYLVEVKDKKHATFKVVDHISAKVTGLTKPAQLLGHTVVEAEFTLTYDFNPLGKALAEPFSDLSDTKKNGGNTEPGKAVFQLYDDGWRLMTQ